MKRPLHKHIAHHTRRYVSHVTKYLYERDTVLSLLMVFVFILLVKFIPVNLHFLDPMKLALQDFDLNDIAYASQLKKGDTLQIDRRIVLVNIGHLDREEISYLIEKTESMKPKVMGLDSYFEGPKDPHKDSALRSVFEKTKNLVVVSYIKEEEHHHHSKKKELNEEYFQESISQRAFANLIGEDGGTLRFYEPFVKIEKKEYPSFTSALVKQFDEKAYERLEKRHKEIETINYSRRLDHYQVLESEDIMMTDPSVDTSISHLIKDKIVLLAYVNENKNDIEDKKFTPMNEKLAGKSTPDMNGIVVHANILSMVLDGNYIRKMPEWVAWLAAVLIGWLHMSLFIRYYLENHIWFHLVVKIAQIISAVFFLYLGLLLFERFRIKLDMDLTFVVIILAVDIIYFYEALAVWMHKRFNYATIFTHHHHPDEQPEHIDENKSH